MMNKTNTVNDVLQERIHLITNELEALIKNYLDDNYPCEVENILEGLDDGILQAIVEGTIPAYTDEIKDIWHLHEDKLIEAYNNMEAGDDPREADGMLAVYCYINEKVNQWCQENIERIVLEWIENNQANLV